MNPYDQKTNENQPLSEQQPTPTAPPSAVNQPVALQAEPTTNTVTPPRISGLKSLFLKVLIGCLVASATVAVTAILAGGLGELGGKALGTIVIVGLHSLLALGFIGMDGTHTEEGNLKVFANVVFGLLIASFVTASLGIWELLPGDLTWRLYASYGVLAVAVLHGELLARILGHQKVTTNIIYANYVVMGLVVLLLLAVIFIPDVIEVVGEILLRPLAALAIIDGTLTLTAVILDRLYLSKHPELITNNSIVSGSKRAGPKIFVIIVGILLGLQLLPALFFGLLWMIN